MKRVKKQNKLHLQYNRDSTKPKWRIYFATLIVFLLFISVSYKALSLQVLDRDKSFKIAKRQHSSSLNLLPKRGNIMDTNGTYLATSVDTISIYINPQLIKDPKKFAMFISENTKFGYKELLAHAISNKSFIWLDRLANPDTTKKLKELNMDGIGYIQEPKRVYPNDYLIGQVLGFTNIDSKGIEGIEYNLDGILSGKPQKISMKRDARGKQIMYSPVDIEEKTRGFDVELTIDSQIQHIVEKELRIGVEKMGGDAGMALLMEPNTGEILAMASYPFFNPNRFKEFPNKTRRNLPVWYTFEPGSTLKIFLTAAAIEEKLANSNTKYDCENGRRKVGPKVIRDSHPHGVLTVAEVIEVSSNICASKIGETLGKKSLYKYLKDFGFGNKLGIDLPGEPRGSLQKTNKWGPVELATISFGQGISVTSLQLASALSTIANGGYLMKPYIVKKISTPGGEIVTNNKPEIIKRVISYDTAKQVATIMEGVVVNGTGKNAQISGYNVAGKTGTAQIPNPNTGGYFKEKYMASFVGFAPVDDPKITLIVVVENPRESIYGGSVSAPIFKAITEKVLFYLNTPTSSGFTGTKLMPNFKGKSTRDILRWADDNGVEVKFNGSGFSETQTPVAGEEIKEDTICSFKLTQDI